MNTSTPSIQVIPATIYPCNVYVFRAHTLDTAREDLFGISNDYAKIIDDQIFTNPGYTVLFTNGSVAIFLREDYMENVGVIVHEAFHATEFVMDYVNIKHSDDTSEVFAYYLQYLVNEILG